jgi:hypothetical protein
MGSKAPTFPFTLPTGGADPPWVSQSYPEKVNSAGPTSPDEPPDDPPLEELLPEVVEELLPDDPPLEELLPELVEELLPDDPLLDEPLPEDPPWAEVDDMTPPPHPARKITASTKTLILSIRRPVESGQGLTNAPSRWIMD